LSVAYLEWVQGEWADSADTVEGRAVHRRVDAGDGKMPEAAALGDDERIHARSVTLSSDWLDGEWLQLSVFQCRLSRRRQIELKRAVDEVINHAEDHVIIIDVGAADTIRPRIESLGKPFAIVERGPVIV
jgi:CRISPR/Cas system-associated endoribonuclease Cas2